MSNRELWSRILAWAGLALMAIGAIDPFEGSVLILPGAAMTAVGASVGASRHRKLLAWASGLVFAGVALMFGMSSMGGIGGDTGWSMWWALVLIPYPVGWVLGIIGSIKRLRELRRSGQASACA
jgi:hypothetical protein